jgi:hypothetical protein
MGRRPKLNADQQTEALKRLAAGETMPGDRPHLGGPPQHDQQVGRVGLHTTQHATDGNGTRPGGLREVGGWKEKRRK